MANGFYYTMLDNCIIQITLQCDHFINTICMSFDEWYFLIFNKKVIALPTGVSN